MNASSPESPFRMAVLISGGGTTLQNFIQKIDAGLLRVQIVLVVSSNPKAAPIFLEWKESLISAAVLEPKPL